MGMSTNVVGIRPPDEAWQKHKAVWDACNSAGVDCPEATRDFFNGETPDDTGVIVQLQRRTPVVVMPWHDDGRIGFEVDLEQLPEGIKRLRFYNSW